MRVCAGVNASACPVAGSIARAALCAAALTLLLLPLRAVEIAASGLSIPFFDASGRLTHKVVAQRGTLSGAARSLEQVEVVYLADGDPSRVVQRVRAQAATWNEKTGVLEGAGPVTVETEENQLSGEGFRFELARSQLLIHRAFRMANPEVVLTADRAVVDLVVERAGDAVALRDVRQCEAIGHLHVTVQPSARRRFDFDEAFSERALYDGATHTVEIPQETRFAKAGRPTGRAGHFSFKLDPKSRPAAQLKR